MGGHIYRTRNCVRTARAAWAAPPGRGSWVCEVMMAIHPLVVQLRFTRSEFLRCLAGVDDQDARRRFQPMNCISWMVGHLADQEHRYWITMAEGKVLFPELNDL